jgi:uncharacterized membrane protein YwzB
MALSIVFYRFISVNYHKFISKLKVTLLMIGLLMFDDHI